jgi:hypothetical protein
VRTPFSFPSTVFHHPPVLSFGLAPQHKIPRRLLRFLAGVQAAGISIFCCSSLWPSPHVRSPDSLQAGTSLERRHCIYSLPPVCPRVFSPPKPAAWFVLSGWMDPSPGETVLSNGDTPSQVSAPAEAEPISPEEQAIPPYWQQHERAQARISYISIDNGRLPPILLEDHTEDGSESSKALWARHVTVDDYVIVNGNPPGVGAYVVWNCTVETLNVGIPTPIPWLAVPSWCLRSPSIFVLCGRR